MNKRNNLFVLITAVTLNLSACSYIQSLFPDKEKDYQYTTEIPPLVLPNDLKAGAVVKAAEEPALLNAAAVKNQNLSAAETEPAEKRAKDTPETEKTGAEVTREQLAPRPEEETGQTAQPELDEQKTDAKEDEKSAKEKGTPVELVRYSDGERRLRIASSPDRAWHLVSKALSRNSIEVTERDQNQKLFYVLYDPDAKKAEDGSLLDEAIFLFKGFEANEKEYLLKLIPVDDKSDLAITDRDLNPLSDEAAVKLLRLLGGTIQGD
ncbi:MAG: outer membrane protein assembly factor BamC [Gammaproteobacteria bacterium]